MHCRMRTSVCLALLCAVLLLSSEVHAHRDLLANGGNGKGNGNGKGKGNGKGNGGNGGGGNALNAAGNGNGNGRGNGRGHGKPQLVCQAPCATCNGRPTNCKTCLDGLALQGNRCIKCSGDNMQISSKGRCQCKASFEFNKDKTACVPASDADTR